MSSRTLLPPWSKYQINSDLKKKEAPETFEWISDPEIRYDYYLAKAALDSLPGSREYLKTYACDEPGESFCDPIGLPLLEAFGSHHSGASVTLLAWTYKFLLNNWDDFVLNTKTGLARRIYDQKQITDEEISNYISSLEGFSHKMSYLHDLQEQYKLPYALETIKDMLDMVVEEREKDQLERLEKEKKRIFEGRLGVLKHHYNHPSRWKDCSNGSTLFGSPFNVTEQMIQVMERTYADYRQHIRSIQDAHAM